MKTFQKKFALTVENHQKGFSLVELLVGVTIALIATVAIFQVFSVYETQKQQTTSDSDALQNGNLAYFLLSNELRQAGQGISTARLNAGKSMQLYGCRAQIWPFENRIPPLPTKDKHYLPLADNFDFQGGNNNTFFGHRPPQNGNAGNYKDTWPVAPILIRTKTNNKFTLPENNGRNQDILITMRSTNTYNAIAPIAEIGSNGNKNFVRFGWFNGKEVKGWGNGNPKYLGFCSAGKTGTYCREAVMAISSDLKKCHITATDWEWKPTYSNGLLNGNLQLQTATRNANPQQQKPDPNTYKNGFLMNLGRLDRGNFSDKGTVGSGNDEKLKDDILTRSGFAMFTAGRLAEAENDQLGTTGNLLRYDLLHDKLEALADNVVLLKAIYGVAPSENSADPNNRNLASNSVWHLPTGDWSYDKLREDNDTARNKIRRIRAIKIALVLRNSFPEIEDKRNAPAKPLPALFKEELGNSAIQITIPANTDEATYHYEVVEFLIPLQNTQYGFDQAYASCMDNKDNKCSQ